VDLRVPHLEVDGRRNPKSLHQTYHLVTELGDGE